MENFIEIAAKTAGIGGLAFGVLLIIFREVIRKNIFPSLAQIQAYKIIRLIIILTFLISISGIIAWVYVSNKRVNITTVEFPNEEFEPVAFNYLSLIDNGEYDTAWQSMATTAKERLSKDTLTNSIRTIREPLGIVINRLTVQQQSAERASDGTLGPFMYLTLNTEFQDGNKWIELVSLMSDKNQWKVAGYHMAPCVPPSCIP